MSDTEYLIREYPLQQGALEIAYIEEYFNEFPERKNAVEIVERLSGRQFQILMAEAPVEDGSTVVPVSYKVSHELREEETDPKLKDLVERLKDTIAFDDRRILYNWLGATRRDWRGRGHFRALTEHQEEWAVEQGFDEVIVKTKNRYYDMFGPERLETLLLESGGGNPSRVLERVEHALKQFRGSREPFDDATMMAVKIA